jgi:sugar O-acyltransferase (sialic acid O-acetyltransferase NeuD family)
LLNANEPEARLASLAVSEGQFVEAGGETCTLETTKATQVVEAAAEGFVRGLRFRPGQTLRAGEILCYLASSPDWEPPESTPPDAALGEAPSDEARPGGGRITRPALALAEEFGVDLSHVPDGTLVTETLVRSLIQGAPSSGSPLDPKSLIVYGAGGHGKSVIELVRSGGIYRIHGIVDDSRPPGEALMGLKVLGGEGELNALYREGIRQAANAVGGIGDIRVRVRIFDRLSQAGFGCPQLIHPSAVVEPSAGLGAGAQIFPQAYIGSECSLGFGVIVNTGAIVSHDCRLADYANISPGAILAGGVEIGPGSMIGMGVTLNLGVRVGGWARIGNGATVKDDVPDGGLVPAGTVWPR